MTCNTLWPSKMTGNHMQYKPSWGDNDPKVSSALVPLLYR